MIIRALAFAAALAALTVPASAVGAPPGYVAATFTGRVPEGTHTEDGFAKRRDCGRRITILVVRPSGLQPASASVICNK